MFPQGLTLLNQYAAAQNAATEKALAGYKLRVLDDAAKIASLRADAAQYKAQADELVGRIVGIQSRLTAREIEIERLQNETQNRLKAVAAMDSESVFNATLPGTVNPVHSTRPVGVVTTGTSNAAKD